MSLGSVKPCPNATEGQGINPNLTYGTDHNDVDGGAARAEVNYGDGTISDFDVTSGTTGFGHTYTEIGTYTLSVFIWDDAGYNTFNNTSWDSSSASTTSAARWRNAVTVGVTSAIRWPAR